MIAADYDITRLNGIRTRIWPYSRGYYPRDTFYHLWLMMENDDATPLIFQTETKQEGLIYETRGDLQAFVELFKDKIILIAESLEKKELAGFFWYDDIHPGERASANVFYRRRFWGETSREATTLCLDYGFRASHLDFKTIWASTPWKTAVSHAEAMGFKERAKIENIGQVNGRTIDSNIMSLEKKDFYDIHKELA